MMAANYIKSISGAAVSDQERAYLLQNIPTLGSTYERNAELISGFDEGAKRNAQSTIETMLGQRSDLAARMFPDVYAPSGKGAAEKSGVKTLGNEGVSISNAIGNLGTQKQKSAAETPERAQLRNDFADFLKK